MAPDWMQGKQLKSEHSQPIEQICEPIKVEQNRMPKNIIKQLMNRVNLNLQIWLKESYATKKMIKSHFSNLLLIKERKHTNKSRKEKQGALPTFPDTEALSCIER